MRFDMVEMNVAAAAAVAVGTFRIRYVFLFLVLFLFRLSFYPCLSCTLFSRLRI